MVARGDSKHFHWPCQPAFSDALRRHQVSVSSRARRASILRFGVRSCNIVFCPTLSRLRSADDLERNRSSHGRLESKFGLLTYVEKPSLKQLDRVPGPNLPWLATRSTSRFDCYRSTGPTAHRMWSRDEEGLRSGETRDGARHPGSAPRKSRRGAASQSATRLRHRCWGTRLSSRSRTDSAVRGHTQHAAVMLFNE